MNPLHNFTYTLMNEKMKILIEKFGLKAEKKGEYMPRYKRAPLQALIKILKVLITMYMDFLK